MPTTSGAGRFAPSPSADLHLGNLRTAVLAWLFARSTGRRFLVRIEDLDDRAHSEVARRQLDDLAAIGVTWDEEPQWQSRHRGRYDAVIADLVGRDLSSSVTAAGGTSSTRQGHRTPPRAPIREPAAGSPRRNAPRSATPAGHRPCDCAPMPVSTP